MTRICASAALAILLLISLHSAVRSGERFPGGELDSFIETFLDWYAVPGLSVAVVQHNEIAYARSWGVKNIDTGESVTTSTLFSTASVTKLFVATAVMQLVEDGLVSLDDPVANYLPYFQMKDERYKTITVRQMLSHTSGMPDTEGEEFYSSWRHPEYDALALERYVRSLLDIPLAGTPGKHCAYSNMAFDVLGDLIAKVSGLPFEDYVQKHILDPLGMKSSTILYEAADSTLMATPHQMNSDLEYEVRDVFPYSRRHPACGTLFSNVLDMSRWAMANNNRGELDGKRILRESSYAVMWNPAVLPDNSFGLGWLLEDYGPYKLYSHGGGDPGFRTEFYILPEEFVGVVVMTNCWEEEINPVAMKALNLALGDTTVDWFAFFRGTLWKSIRESDVDATVEKCRQLTREFGKDNFHPAILNQIGNRLLAVDRTEEACRLFELNIEYYPDIYQLHNSLAGAYLKLDRRDLALGSCQKSLELKPGNEGAARIMEALRRPGPGGSASRTEMVRVEGGSFMMGNSGDGGDADERPVHPVSVASFYIDRHETTVGEFREFVEATGYRTTSELGMDTAMVYVGRKAEKRLDASWKNPHYEQDDRHPVVCVSWLDAVAYCNWRSVNEGLQPCYSGRGDSIVCDFKANGYRLPTEAEWEYAARSCGRDVTYAWGEGAPYRDGKPAGNTRDEAAHRTWKLQNYWENYDDGYAYTAPACSFAPNQLGICDMSGNVYEWCWDWYSEDYYAHSPTEDPTGPAAGDTRCCRDAGFVCPIEEERVVSRGLGKPTLAFSWGGFRIARSGD